MQDGLSEGGRQTLKIEIIFRSPANRRGGGHGTDHPVEDVDACGWFEEWSGKDRIAGGSGLTLNGRLIDANRGVVDGIHHNGKEIVGGFLILKAGSLDEAAGIARSCPIYEFDGYSEVREMQNPA